MLIDDSINYLKDVQNIGARAALAKWGYSSRKQIKEARKAGIPVIGGRRKPSIFGRWKLQRLMRRIRRGK